MFKIYRRKGQTDLVEIEKFNFSGGEIHFKADSDLFHDADSYCIETTLCSSEEIMLMLMVADYLKTLDKSATLNLQYVPYARQDRQTSPNEPFSFKTFARLLNSCNFTKVYISDPHSDVTAALIDNVVIYNRCDIIPHDLVEGAICISPDAGAQKQNHDICTKYGIEHVIATKKRCIKSGDITETQVHTDLDLKGKKLVIFDDICDGGRTFIELSKVLKTYNPESIHLYVTYGIFSKGIEVVEEHFDSVTALYRTNQ